MPATTWDLIIIGGGLGACAAALSATNLGCRVLMTEQTAWIGGQLTSQGVPPDEHQWIESYGRTASYALLRDNIRQYYRDHYPLRPEAHANPLLNPGQGWVSALCAEPRVSLAVIEQMLAPAVCADLLDIRLGWTAVAAEISGDQITSVTIREMATGCTQTHCAMFYLDATETGELLPLAGAEYRTGAESATAFNELHGAESDQPDNVQAFTWCIAAGFDPTPGATHVIDKPDMCDFWRGYHPNLAPVPWPGALLSDVYANPFTLEPRRLPIMPGPAGGPDMFTYRRIVSAALSRPDALRRDTTIVNWPQNDYLPINIIDKPATVVDRALYEARQLSLSLLYWMQTEAPRSDGGEGYPALTPASEIFGTPDGLALAPYIRESRRIEAGFTVTEEHVGEQMLRLAGRDRAVAFPDSVGIGHYRIDLHPSTGGDNYIDIESRSFQIPLGALIPIRMVNLLPACKNIGTTHITNGCFRLHPVEWNIGESAGYLAAWCVKTSRSPHQVRENADMLHQFQELIVSRGVQTQWPADHEG